MSRPRTMVINPWHWLDEHGALPASPPALRARALRVAQCIEYGGPLARGHWRETLIACHRRPSSGACPGLLAVLKQVDDAILAFCPICQSDDYLIYEWEDTMWSSGPMPPIAVERMIPPEQRSPRPQPGPESGDELLARTLALLRSPLTSADLRRLVASAAHPAEVVQAVLSSLPTPPLRASIERFLPVLMALWNDTRAAELARAPRPAPTPTRIGVNQPCPCGSGKKYKRCCMHHEPVH